MSKNAQKANQSLEDLFRQICISKDLDREEIQNLAEQILTHSDCTISGLANFIGHPETYGANRDNQSWLIAADIFFISDILWDGDRVIAELTLDQMLDCDLSFPEDPSWQGLMIKKFETFTLYEQLLEFRRIMTIPREVRDDSRNLFLRYAFGSFNITDGHPRAKAVNDHYKETDGDFGTDPSDEFLSALADLIEWDCSNRSPVIHVHESEGTDALKEIPQTEPFPK